ncbi:MAG: hypothetical protein ACOY0T_31010 [Myxococcota bacterium]
MNREWGRERWRKQYVREPLQERAWPVMARGLRELLNKLAEDDGSLVRDASDPQAALVEALAPRSEERELVQAAISLLLREGVLGCDTDSIWIPELPASQVVRVPPSEAQVRLEPTRTPASSTERVQRHREKKRAAAERGALVSSRAEAVTDDVSPGVSRVAAAVSCNVSSSRGERNLGPSHSLNTEKDKQRDHLHPSYERAQTGVPRVTGAVTPRVSSTAPAVTTNAVSGKKDEDEQFNFKAANEVHAALELPIQQRAALVLENPRLGRTLRPERWLEVKSVATALAEASGAGASYLGSYDDDPGVQAVLKAYAAGIPQTALEFVARTVPRQPWWSSNGKRLGLSSLSLEVVRRNLPGADGRARVTSPGVAKALDLLRSEAEVANE